MTECSNINQLTPLTRAQLLNQCLRLQNTTAAQQKEIANLKWVVAELRENQETLLANNRLLRLELDNLDQQDREDVGL